MFFNIGYKLTDYAKERILDGTADFLKIKKKSKNPKYRIKYDSIYFDTSKSTVELYFKNNKIAYLNVPNFIPGSTLGIQDMTGSITLTVE